jgi:phage gp46-like protein
MVGYYSANYLAPLSMDNALHQITVIAASACLGLLMLSVNFASNNSSRFAESLETQVQITQKN